jgi:hypothetical protein
MRSTIKATNPNEVDFTMSVTMPLGDWRKLAAQLESNAHPSWVLSRDIRNLVSKATAEFVVEGEAE